MAASVDQVIVLVTSTPSTTGISGNQSMMKNQFESKGVSITEIDGAAQENRELRNELFGISEKRGAYPQVFIKEGGETKFVGDYEAFEELIESDSLPADVLENNPTIPTFTKTFANFTK
eukprot:CAMPEP_0185768104 /NCGR_PEP_ID=MMETSP1174-20130828/47463_1 /TAXON_ID=35687 /ORGANISM="Dictyocha speculum, Strain CCMP1381" /LENGTH=118 /DNA_ID=CAMNT_0028452641 /DNA_START=19 /DNA_END=375 /DNA_ORIENTATION=+